METTYRFIIAALAAAVALSSCTKDIAADREDVNPQDGVRTISVSFAAQTKTTLDGLQPEFDKGDVIKVSNGSACEEKVIDLDPQGNAFFTTSLTGALTAVYPATAAALEGNNITGVKVPAIQTGKFKDANICMADIAANATSATFHNKTAILRFYVEESLDVRAIAIQSTDSDIATESKQIEVYNDATPPQSSPGGGMADWSSLKPLAQGTDDPGKRISYVAVLPGEFEGLYLFSYAPSQESTSGEMTYRNVTLNEGDIANAFIPYYIEVNVSGTLPNPTIQRWSYCNIGAFLPEEAGYYYSWGNVDGHWRNGIKEEGEPFSMTSYAGTDGEGLGDNITYEHDAAYAAWADKREGTWRMPTEAEYETLLGMEPEITDEGLAIPGTALKFPFAGRVEGNELILTFSDLKAMSYWTATIHEEGNAKCMVAAYGLDVAVSGTQPSERYVGMPIRPIYGEPAVEPTNIEIQSFEEKGNI